MKDFSSYERGKQLEKQVEKCLISAKKRGLIKDWKRNYNELSGALMHSKLDNNTKNRLIQALKNTYYKGEPDYEYIDNNYSKIGVECKYNTSKLSTNQQEIKKTYKQYHVIRDIAELIKILEV